MNNTSFENDLKFNDKTIAISVILETSFTKEIRIAFKKGQTMKEHQAAFPIVVHVLEGLIQFGMEGKTIPLKKGSIITLDANVPHDLHADEQSIVRLTLSKGDTAERVKNIS